MKITEKNEIYTHSMTFKKLKPQKKSCEHKAEKP